MPESKITGHVLHALVPSTNREDAIAALHESFNGSLCRPPSFKREVHGGNPSCGTGFTLDEIVCVIRHDDPPDNHVRENLRWFAECMHKLHPHTTVLVRCDLFGEREFAV